MNLNSIIKSIEKAIFNGIEEGFKFGSKSNNSNQFIAGDVDIIDITIMSEDRQRRYSLMTMCKAIMIYESILSPVIFAELKIVDPNGIRQSFPIIAEEYVVITFKTPGSAEPAKYFLRVNSVGDAEIKQGNKTQTYTLQCCSVEVLTNAKTPVDKKFKGTADVCITELLTDKGYLGSEKPFIKESCKGVFEGICPGNAQPGGTSGSPTPFVAIDYIRRLKSFSTRYLTHSFVFFENRHGFNFVTIEKLMEDGAKAMAAGASDKQFFFDSNSKLDARNVTVRDIIAYNQSNFATAVSKVQTGALYKIVNHVDLSTMNTIKLNYTDNIGSNSMKFADGASSAAATTTTFQQNHGKTTAESVLRFTSGLGDMAKDHYPEKLSIISSYADKLTQNITDIHIYGDTEITVGDMIKCTLPSAKDTDDNTGKSRLDSGNYLVSKLCHIILNTDRPQHTIALQLLKGGFTEN
jgi:hypothetical protein